MSNAGPHPLPTERLRGWLSRRAGFKRSVSAALEGLHRQARKVGLFTDHPVHVADHAIRTDRWPAGTRLTVAALADLHFGGSYVDQPRLDTVIDRTNALGADLVVLLGDYGASHLEGPAHRRAMRTLAASLRRLDAPLGVVAVLGNHDWWDDPEAQATGRTPIISAEELRAAGITVLENEAVALQIDGQPFWVAGLGDQWARLGPPNGRRRRSRPSHRPAGRRRARDLIVSAGLGTSSVPLRIGTRPEIVHLTVSG